MSIPVTISARSLAGAALCVIGEPPRPTTMALLGSFLALLDHAFGKPVPMRYAGADAGGCGSGRVVVLRLFSGAPPHAALSADLARLDAAYGLGLPPGRYYAVVSPAMAQTFFGRRGQVTHILVQQPPGPEPDRLQSAYFRSILVEELFQAFTFGADILVADRNISFQSKLQEVPINLSRLSWNSPEFMRALLQITPAALCRFDIFMLHALAETPVDQTIEPAFVAAVESDFAALEAMARATVADPRFAPIIARDCRRADTER